MAVSDRLREMDTSAELQTVESQKGMESSTLVVVDPTVRRISGLLRELSVLFGTMKERDWLVRQLRIILDAVREEVEEDSELFANPAAKTWIVQFSQLMEWTATGDYSKLNPELLTIACTIDGIPLPEPMPQEEPLFELEDAAHS